MLRNEIFVTFAKYARLITNNRSHSLANAFITLWIIVSISESELHDTQDSIVKRTYGKGER